MGILFKSRNEKLVIQVGLDFGTSSSKIAYQIIGGVGKIIKPIYSNHRLKCYPRYCFPSVAAFDESKNLLIACEAEEYLQERDWREGMRRLKVIVAGRKNSEYQNSDVEKMYFEYLESNHIPREQCQPEHMASVLIAYSIREIRNYLTRYYENYDVDIIFNIGIPIDQSEDKGILAVFEKIIAAAQEIELKWKGTNNDLIKLAAERYSDVHYNKEDDRNRVFLSYESKAQIYSYLQSLESREGIHAVLDFGSGTTDCSIFYLTDVRKWNATDYWYAAKNIPVGTYFIENLVSEYLKKQMARVTPEVIYSFLKDPIKFDEEIGGRVRCHLEKLWQQTKYIWANAYKKYQNQSVWEKDKVKVFICGGGSFFKQIPIIFCESWQNNWGPYPIKRIPAPENFDTINDSVPFERMTVAYGLAYPIPEMGKSEMPSEIDEFPPLPRELRPDFSGIYEK